VPKAHCSFGAQVLDCTILEDSRQRHSLSACMSSTGVTSGTMSEGQIPLLGHAHSLTPTPGEQLLRVFSLHCITS
jgi:hypothetical protein